MPVNIILNTWIKVKAERNYLLSQSDWTQLLDAPLLKEEQLKWKEFRQTLRDLPQVQADKKPIDVIFPTDPDGKVFDKLKSELV